MTMDYEAAAAQVTAPGERFEVQPIDVGGVTYKAFVNALPSLRDLFAMAHGRGDATFLVYEDERWTLRRRHAPQVDALGARPRRALRRAEGRPGGHRHAQLPRVGRRLRRHHLDRRHLGVAQRVVDRGRARLRARGLRRRRCSSPTPSASSAAAAACERLGIADHRRARRPRPAADVDRWDDVVVAGAAAARRRRSTPTTTPRSSTRRAPPASPKGAVSTHRAVVQALLGFGCRAAIDRAAPARGRRRRADPPAFILIVPLFHVTGCVPVMLSCFAGGLEARDHVQVGPRAGARAHRARAGHQLRRRADAELGPARVARASPSSTRRACVSVGGGGAPAPPELVRARRRELPQGRARASATA